MGGRALLKYGIETERKSSQEFYDIAARIGVQLSYGLGLTATIPVMFEYSPNIQSQSVRCFRTKQDHGDLDVLIKVDKAFHDNKIDLKAYIEKNFKPQVIHSNGGVLSFDYEKFQIDFIPIRESNWEIAQVYFSYDPLGNAMGKTFHKMNLSYGWDGLKYKYRNFNGRNSRDLIISKNPEDIFEFGGYDYGRYLKGFDTIEEIFEFIVDGDNFDSKMFEMESLTHIDRKRNRKRGSYHAFLQYIQDNKYFVKGTFMDKDEYIPIIDEFFPEAKLREKLKVLDERDAIDKKLSEKLNGRKIMEWVPGLSGKLLGEVISSFRQGLGEKYEEIILESTEEQIMKRFKKFIDVNEQEK